MNTSPAGWTGRATTSPCPASAPPPSPPLATTSASSPWSSSPSGWAWRPVAPCTSTSDTPCPGKLRDNQIRRYSIEPFISERISTGTGRSLRGSGLRYGRDGSGPSATPPPPPAAPPPSASSPPPPSSPPPDRSDSTVSLHSSMSIYYFIFLLYLRSVYNALQSFASPSKLF